MVWQYSQRTGQLRRKDGVWARGYSGKGPGDTARLAIFFFLFVSGHAMSSPAAPDAATLLAEIRDIGPLQVIGRLNAQPNPNAWDGVMHRIRSGQADWLDVAAGLAQEADAGSASDLKISLAHALLKNPEGVLKLAGSQVFLSIDEICGAPFIEPTSRFLRHYLEQAKRAVGQVRDPQLKPRQAACLSRINDAERQLRSTSKAGR